MSSVFPFLKEDNEKPNSLGQREVCITEIEVEVQLEVG